MWLSAGWACVSCGILLCDKCEENRYVMYCDADGCEAYTCGSCNAVRKCSECDYGFYCRAHAGRVTTTECVVR